jgi:dihydropteroate synthase
MQQLTQYNNVVTDVIDFFVERTDACRKAGIKDVIIDPGFGFAKTPAQNFQLLRELQSFQIFGLPVLLGVSRKSTICKTLNISADEALNGTTVLNTIGLLNGASILRVHDVKEAVEAVKLVAAVNAAHS